MHERAIGLILLPVAVTHQSTRAQIISNPISPKILRASKPQRAALRSDAGVFQRQLGPCGDISLALHPKVDSLMRTTPHLSLFNYK
jgi:hypothetical protein